MQTYELLIYDRAIKALSDDTTLVRTSRGVDEIKFYFDSPEWLEGFDLSVAFKNGETLEELPLELTEIVGGDYLAQATCEVPDSVLLEAGRLGVTVHGVNEDGDHIITERAFPLTVELEGDEEYWPPIPIPYVLDLVEVAAGGKTGAKTDTTYSVTWSASGTPNWASSTQGIIVNTHGYPVKISIGKAPDQQEMITFGIGLCPSGVSVAEIPSSMAMRTTMNGSNTSMTITPTDEMPYAFVKVSSTRDRAGGHASVSFQLA